MNTVLVMTVGQSDVQLVRNGKKCDFDKSRMGALHDLLREHRCSWVLVEAPVVRGEMVKELPDEPPWEICVPKLDAVLAYFGDKLPDSMLVLETTRNIPGDPRFAGGVLQRRAKDKGVADVRCCSYLGPADRNLGSPDCPLDAIVRRDVVRCIESGIRDAVSTARRVVVSTGGMPEIKMLVKELVRLHAPAGSVVDEVEVEDGARNGNPDKAVPRRDVDPIEPIRLRKQALSLIDKGSLIGAWGSVQHIDAQAHPWVQVIEWLYCFAASLPMPGGCDIDEIQHELLAARAALRVELSLRERDIPRAVHGTVAFFEAALWDWLRRRDFAKEDGAISGSLASGFTFANLDGEMKTRFHKNGRINDFDNGVKAWLPVLAKPALSALRNALSDDVRCLRHDVAHNQPTPALMSDARTRMQAAALWSRDDTFLSQTLVQDVLKELGVAHPAGLLSALLAEVRGRLLNP